MRDYSVKIQELGNLEDYLENISVLMRQKAVKRAVAAACKVVRNAAKLRCPVATGTLKKSIAYVVREYNDGQRIVGIVGVKRGASAIVNGKTRDAARYGHLVEFGYVVKNFSGDTDRIGASPFLRPAADETRDEQEMAIIVSLSADLKESKGAAP